MIPEALFVAPQEESARALLPILQQLGTHVERHTDAMAALTRLWTTHYEWVSHPPNGQGWVRYYADKIDLTNRAHPVVGALGKHLALIGFMGAGKTTTIGMLVGLIEPTGGRCFIKDIEVTRNPLQVKRMIGYLPEGAPSYGEMTPREFLAFIADAPIKPLRIFLNVNENDLGAGDQESTASMTVSIWDSVISA